MAGFVRVEHALLRQRKPLAEEMFSEWDNAVMMGGIRGLGSLHLSSMFLCRGVDAFQRILVTFVGEVFKVKPETMTALEGQVDVVEVLNCATLDEFRERLAARKLRRLGPFSQVRKFLRKLGVEVKLNKQNEQAVTEAVELRDLIVHGGARVDDDYLLRTKRTDVKLGTAISIDRVQLRDTLKALRTAADAFQIALGEKYFGGAKTAMKRHWSPS